MTRPHTAQRSGKCTCTWSGFSTACKVRPVCPGCPPRGFLSLGKIRFFRYPSLLGGLWLFWLFSPNRRLNSMFSACRRAFSACRRAFSARRSATSACRRTICASRELSRLSRISTSGSCSATMIIYRTSRRMVGSYVKLTSVRIYTRSSGALRSRLVLTANKPPKSPNG
jgi:hypothetical protein